MATGGSKIAIYGAIIANLLIASMKFIASYFTHSSAMLSEGIHSIVDTTNGILLLHGINKSKKEPTKSHPFGYGMEIYFWSFVVAIFIFSLGGGIAIYEGIEHLKHPKELDSSTLRWNYIVLVLAILFEGTSLLIALRLFRKNSKGGFIKSIIESKDAATFAIIFEETAAIGGLLIALLGIFLADYTGNSMYDGVASILIGILLSIAALFMAKETKGLLIGESATEDDINIVHEVMRKSKNHEAYGNIRTMHLGPEEIILVYELNLEDDMNVGQVEILIADLKKELKERNPRFKHVYIETDNYMGKNSSIV